MDYIILAAICLIFVVLLIYMYIRDLQTNRKFYLYEKSVEDMNKKIFDLEKKIKKIEHEKTEKEYDGENIEEEVKKITSFIDGSVKEIERSVKNAKEEMDKKIEYLESKIKSVDIFPDNFQNNDKKIVNLYNKGLSTSEIARNLRIGVGEVELVLKIAGLK